MLIAAYLLALISLLLASCLFVRLKPPYSFYFFVFQILVGALAPLLAVVGVVGAMLGWLAGAWLPFAAGLGGAVIATVYSVLVTAPQPGFAAAFGEDWESRLSPAQRSSLLQTRWRLGLPRGKEATVEQDIVFWTIPGTERALLCDVWQPASDVARSGLAFVYLHGGAWYIGEKGTLTRPLFEQLTGQGHVVVDVGYRLVPEVDIHEMVGDAKRAVAWLKENADRYGIDPAKIVLGGGSAGGHLALLAAYTPAHPALTPPDLEGHDLTVRAVVSLYGPTDLTACYAYLHQKRFIDQPRIEIGQPGAATMQKGVGDAGRLDWLLGGHLHEVPEIYALASPITHVGPNSPPTLLIQGEPDVIAPVAATRTLHARLDQHGVQAANIIYPLTNHGFDLVFPQVSPPAQAALYYTERFLALMALECERVAAAEQ